LPEFRPPVERITKSGRGGIVGKQPSGRRPREEACRGGGIRTRRSAKNPEHVDTDAARVGGLEVDYRTKEWPRFSLVSRRMSCTDLWTGLEAYDGKGGVEDRTVTTDKE